jgi:hypothetical protein
MKNDASGFLEWFEKEREGIMDRIFKVLEEDPYEELGCGLVMELHHQALTAAAQQVMDARAEQKGYRAAIVPFSGYEQYRYSLSREELMGDPEYSAPKKRRGPGRKAKDSQKKDDTPQLFPTSESKEPSTQGGE